MALSKQVVAFQLSAKLLSIIQIAQLLMLMLHYRISLLIMNNVSLAIRLDWTGLVSCIACKSLLVK